MTPSVTKNHADGRGTRRDFPFRRTFFRRSGGGLPQLSVAFQAVSSYLPCGGRTSGAAASRGDHSAAGYRGAESQYRHSTESAGLAYADDVGEEAAGLAESGELGKTLAGRNRDVSV